MLKSKQIHIIAGPNGSGKTSLARIVLLPKFLKVNEFVNADEIAKLLSPKDPDKSALPAGRIMISKIDNLLLKKKNFAIETTLSARNYIKMIKKAKALKYKVNLIFLCLENWQLAHGRVKDRVKKGGHDIPLEVIKRRFKRGLENLQEYLDVVDTAIIFESSGLDLIKIAAKNRRKLKIYEKSLWQRLNEE